MRPAISVVARQSRKFPRFYPGWWAVFVCFWLAVLAWGIGFYGHGVYLTQLEATRSGSALVLSFATTGYYLVGATLMIFTGTAIERFGSRNVVLVCTFALCASLALLPFVSASWQIVPAYLLMAIGWAGTSWTAIPCILARWFDRHLGLAISIAFSGASFGGIIVPPLLIYLSNGYGFAQAAESVAVAGFVIVGTFAALLLHRGPEIFGLPIDGATIPGRPDAKRCADDAIQDHTEPPRTFRFWTTTTAFSLALVTQVGFLTHQIPLLAPALGTQLASFAVAITTASSICGRLALGLVIDRLEPRAVSAVAFTLQAVALIALSSFGAQWAVFAACVVYGVWIGNIITLPALIIQREFHPGVFAATMGLVTSISQFTFAFGPGFLGLLHDAAGSYVPVLLTCAAFNLTAGALVLVPRYVSRLVMNQRGRPAPDAR